MTTKTDNRRSPMRRQMNEAFCDPNGQFAISKFVAVWGQIVLLFQMGRSFDALIDRWEALVIVGSFIIMPELIKKIISAKYGGGVK